MKTNGRILLCSHNLNIEGAPKMLYNLALLLKKNRYKVEVISFLDGPLKKELLKNGIPVCIENNISQQDLKKKEDYFFGFDLIIVNTIMGYPIVEYFDKKKQVIWYLHEGKTIVSKFIKEVKGLEELLSNANHVIVVSHYVKDYLMQNKVISDAKILTNYVEDINNGEIQYVLDKKKVVITVVGTINYNKGFDLVIQAYNQLENEYKKKIIINFVGDINDVDYFQDCCNAIPDGALITWNGVLDGVNKWNLFKTTDVFIVPSRDESCSLVTLEACMLGKPVVISNNVGAQYMVTPQNGWTFMNEDILGLKEILKKIVLCSKLKEMGDVSRELYLQYATRQVYEENLLKIINDKKWLTYRKTKSYNLNKKQMCISIPFWINEEYLMPLTAFALQTIFQNENMNTYILNYIPGDCKKEFIKSVSYGYSQRNLTLSSECDTFEKLNDICNATDIYFLYTNELLLKNKDINSYIEMFGGNGKRIQKIACFEIDKYTQNDFEKNYDSIIIQALSRFNGYFYNGIRSNQTQNFLSPIFFLNIEEWKRIIGRRRMFKEYTCAYIKYGKISTERIQYIFKQDLGVIISDEIFYVEKELEIEEWLSCIYYSEEFVTDTYIGACFGLILKKRFVFLKHNENETEKVELLLKKILGEKYKNENAKKSYIYIDVLAYPSVEISNILHCEKQNWIKKINKIINTNKTEKEELDLFEQMYSHILKNYYAYEKKKMISEELQKEKTDILMSYEMKIGQMVMKYPRKIMEFLRSR